MSGAMSGILLTMAYQHSSRSSSRDFTSSNPRGFSCWFTISTKAAKSRLCSGGREEGRRTGQRKIEGQSGEQREREWNCEGGAQRLKEKWEQ